MTFGEWSSRRCALAALLLSPILAPAGEPARAGDEDPHAACRAAAEAAEAPARPPAASDTRVELLDVGLLDQDGRPARLPALVGDDVVVMDFVFTSCTTVCPILSARFARLQERLAGRIGRGARLLSLSIDPARDTPARLRAYADRWKARDGWSFLTGPRADVERVLKGLGAYTPGFADHAPMVLVGDGRTGRWSRFNGFPDVERLAAQVEAILEARPAPRTAAAGRR